MKKFISLFLSIVMLLSITSGINLTAQAQTGVEAKIASIHSKYPNNSFFSKNGKACIGEGKQHSSCSNCQLSNIDSATYKANGDGYSCWAFATYVFYNVFGVKTLDSSNTTKTVKPSELNSNAKYGDFVVCYNSSGQAIHYFIYLGSNGSNHYRYESNYVTTNKVHYKGNCPATGYSGDSVKVAKYKIIHAKNYNTINGTTTTTTTVTNPSVTVKAVSNLKSDSVQLNFTANNPSKVTIKTVGVQVRMKGSSTWTTKSEAMNSSYVNAASTPMWWTVGSGKEVNMKLYAGLTYEYRAYVVYNGNNYYSSINTFKTTGTHTHSYNSGTVKYSATCTSNGSKLYTCTICGATKTEVISAYGHSWNSGEITISPSCTDNGEKTYTCNNCGETKTESVPANGHTVVKDKAVSATCTSKGKTEGSHCSVCGTVIVAQKSVAAKGHTSVKDKAVSATCTSTGKTEGSHCSVCGTVIVAQKTTPALGHDFGDNQQTCSVCGEENPNYVEPVVETLSDYDDVENYEGTNTNSNSANQTIVITVAQPKKTSIKKLSSGSKLFKVTWKKISGVSGYQIQYATDSKFKKNKKTVTVKGNKSKKPSKTIKKLKSNKTYYVRVRSYKTVNGQKVYSSWSNVKKIKTK